MDCVQQTPKEATPHPAVDQGIMLAIDGSGAAQTMSSREIAALVGKEHKNALRDVRVLKDQLRNLFGGMLKLGHTPRTARPTRNSPSTRTPACPSC